MHIAEQVTEALVADGWNNSNHSLIFKKRLPTGGAFGFQIMTLRIDNSGRWLERVDGWGNVERGVDLRDFPNDPVSAIETVMK